MSETTLNITEEMEKIKEKISKVNTAIDRTESTLTELKEEKRTLISNYQYLSRLKKSNKQESSS